MSYLSFREITDLVSRGDQTTAEEEARRWLVSPGPEAAVLGKVGAVFIDIGSYTGALGLVEEGVILTRQARGLAPGTSLTYNLANGLSRLLPDSPEVVTTVTPDPALSEVLSLYYEAIDAAGDVRPEPSFNFASALLRAGRAIEGLDLARETLTRHPEHGRGWAALGDMLWGVWAFYNRYPDLLQDAVAAYQRALVFEVDDLPFRDRLASNITRAQRLLDEVRPHPHPDMDPARTVESLLLEHDPWDEQLEAFVWKSGLGLNLCSGCRVESPMAYDRYPLAGILVGPEAKEQADRTPAEVNVLLQGFIGARSLLWLSRAQATAPVEILSWPVTGLAFSRRSAFLAAAFRESYGVLDRIADLWNARLGIDAAGLYFDKLFFTKANKVLAFRSSVAWPDSVGLRALMYLSASFERDNGRFNDLRASRNDLQHSLVLHGTLEGGRGWPWDTIADDDLERRTFQLLRLVRAAILYCCEGLRSVEHEKRRRVKAEGAIVLDERGTGVNRS